MFPNQPSAQSESNVLIKNIDKVLTDDGDIVHCEPAVLFDDDDEVDEFMLLDKMLNQCLTLYKTKFAKDVLSYYYNNKEPIKSWINEIMFREEIPNIKVWKVLFLQSKHSLTFQYLPFLSSMYHLIFRLCTVEFHSEHKYLFVSTKEVLDFSSKDTKISVYVLTERSCDSTRAKPVKGIFVTGNDTLVYLHKHLQSTDDTKAKVDLLNKIAYYYQCQAEKINITHHLESLQQWNRAMKFYKDSLTLNRKHLHAMLGYAKCLIMLNKYTLAKEFLVENVDDKEYFRDSAERWLLLGVLRRKLRNYDEAEVAIKTALKLQNNYVEAKNELDFIFRLKKEIGKTRIESYKRLALQHGEPKFDQYNILSIDGGGIRGLIPAVWMSELERRTGLSSSSMFHMMAGTSTGAIVTACLSLPDTSISIKQPRYGAVDIVELYTLHSDKVFTQTSRWENFFGIWPKYHEANKKDLFEQYFKDTRLSHALTELIITTVNSGSSATELFRRSDGLKDPSRNHKFSDILMCTTAAPTYFPAYKLSNSVFVDGGVQANNPAMIAYADACTKNINRDNIFILSLGTGDYVPDPLNPNAQRSLLFWGNNSTSVLKVIFDGPQNNIDYQLSSILNTDMYHRWQIWLENPIVLDDIRKETLDYLIELAHSYFEEMDAFDNNHRLGKIIERLKRD
ncbi:unnamed protein product [Adineta ricciae]|uniref:PNPLA domain-containing protein n=1 Tax=Adineta ricciae TaxID=249248 RepID=A0A815L3S0_ADIRI|nr:unnamed protein product [Adineta ricciae]